MKPPKPMKEAKEKDKRKEPKKKVSQNNLDEMAHREVVVLLK